MTRNTSKPIEIDPKFQLRESRIEKIGCTLLGVLLLSSLTGLLGDGPLANQELAVEQAKIRFEKIERARDDTQLEIRYATEKTEVRVAISQDYLDHLRLKSILPTPRILSGKEQTIFIFEKDRSADSSLQARFVFEANEPGRLLAHVTVDETLNFTFHQYILP